MFNILLYILVTLIWGSTWYAIKLQLGVVPPAWSLTYRFFIAAILLLGFCFLKGQLTSLSRREHLYIALQGLLMFSANYLVFYYGTFYLITGLVALVYAGMLVFNIIFSYLFFKKPISKQTSLAALFGIAGLIMAFWSELSSLVISSQALFPFLIGVVLSLTGAMISSLGNMVATVNLQKNISIIQINAFGMFYGTIALALYALCVDGLPVVEWNFSYVSALFYLAIFGTIIAFGAYTLLIKNLGAEKAAYSFVATPLIALLISTFLENFQWTPGTLLGIMLIMFGNVMILRKSRITDKSLPNLKEAA